MNLTLWNSVKLTMGGKLNKRMKSTTARSMGRLRLDTEFKKILQNLSVHIICNVTCSTAWHGM